MLRFECLLVAIAIDIWLISAFLLVRCVRWAFTFFNNNLLNQTQAWILFGCELAVWIVWFFLGFFGYRSWNRVRSPLLWLLGGEWRRFGTTDRSGTLAALAGFALAQGAALTAVAKGKERDAIIVGIYAIIVVFSYFWARQVLYSGCKSATVQLQTFDATTIENARYTLAWIVFLGTIMITLACYDLLPNQQWRLRFAGDKLACGTQLASNYAADRNYQDDRLWVTWASAGAAQDRDPENQADSMVWIESTTSFDGDYDTFYAVLKNASRFKVHYLVAFVKSQSSPLVRPTYRQLPVHRPTSLNNAYTIDVVEPNAQDRIVILAQVKDTALNTPYDGEWFWLERRK